MLVAFFLLCRCFEVCAETKKIVEEFGADDITANQKQNKAGVPPFPVIVGI